MPRKRLIRTPHFAYHVINRSVDQLFYPKEHMTQVWDLACDLLCIATWCFGARIHAFVLMSNHYHLLISTPDENLDDIMRYFQSEFSRTLTKWFKTQTLCFGTRYKSCLIDNPGYYFNVVRYIYQNPLRAGVVERVESYPWSTLTGVHGRRRLRVPLYPQPNLDLYLPAQCTKEELDWLNTRIPADELGLLESGLRKSQFALPIRTTSTLPKV